MLTIISGGQTGADLGGLRAARDAGVATGGWAPKGWRTEQGPQEAAMRAFGLKECQRGRTQAERYRARTAANVVMSDAVLIFGQGSRGSNLTQRLAQGHHDVWWWEWWKGSGVLIPPRDVESIVEWLQHHNPDRLMVAGNRESGNPGIEQAVRDLMAEVFSALLIGGAGPGGEKD